MEEGAKRGRAVVIDDEQRSRAALMNKLERYCPEVEVVGQGQSVLEARLVIERARPDLLFLDIELGQETVFELLAHYPHPPFLVIFVTGFQHYALRAFRCSNCVYGTAL